MSPLSRRAFLGIAGAVTTAVAGAAGCDGAPLPPPSEHASDPPAGTGDSGPDTADAGIVATAVATHRALQRAYGGLARAHPSTRRQVQVLVDQLGEHVVALGQPSAPTGRPSKAPRDRARALARVRDAEEEAGAERAADSRRAESGDLARVLASVAGSHAQHVAVLDDLLGSGP